LFFYNPEHASICLSESSASYQKSPKPSNDSSETPDKNFQTPGVIAQTPDTDADSPVPIQAPIKSVRIERVGVFAREAQFARCLVLVHRCNRVDPKIYVDVRVGHYKWSYTF
jgi:hypothetical protein